MRVLLGLVAAAALGLGAWLLLRGPADEDLALEGLDRTDPGDSSGPTLEGLDGGERPATRAPTGHSSIAGRVSRDGAHAAAEVTLKFLHGRVGPDRTYPRRGVEYYRRVVFGRPPAAPLVVASRATDASGRFEFAGLGLGVYRVEARASDGARGMSVVAVGPEGVRATTEVRLAAPGAAFEGRVEWSDGVAFEGDLLVTPTAGAQDGWGTTFRSSSEGVAAALTDGTFRIEGLGAGRFSVQVLVGDETVASGPGVSLPQQEPYKLVVLRPTRELRGRVLVKGEETPIADAEIYASGRGTDGGPAVPSTRAATDGEGRFSVRISPGAGWLTVAATGFSRRSVTLAADAKELTVLLSRTGGVRGRVVSVSDAAPVAGTVVHATGKDGTTQTAATDRDGRFTIEGVASGEAQVFVRGGGWISPELGRTDREGRNGYNPLAVEIRAGTASTLELRAEQAGSLHGRVIDAGGTPVAGAVIWGRFDGSPGMRGGGSPPTTSGADGTFRVENLGVGANLTLDVRAPEHAPTRSGPHAVTLEDPTALEIRLEAPRWVDALVLTQGTDAPVPEANVQLMRTERFGNNHSNTQDASALTGPDGRARLGPVGAGTLQAWAYGGLQGSSGSEQVGVEGSETGAAELKVTLRLRPTALVEGRVELPDGAAAVGARLVHEIRPGQASGPAATSGPDGRFRLRVETAQEALVRASLTAADGARLTAAGAAAPGTKDLVLRLAPDDRPLRILTVRVTDANGLPVARASISLVGESRDGGSSSSSQPVQEGVTTFELAAQNNETLVRALDEGRAFLTVNGARDESDLPLPLGPARVGPLAKDQREIAIRLPAERRIEGRVLGPDGRGLRGVLVRATPQEPTNEDGSHRQPPHTSDGRSGEDGTFRVGGLSDGLFALTIFGPATTLVPTLEPVQSGTLDVVISLRAGVTARVRVTDAQGNPAPSCQVSAGPPPRQEARFGPDGDFSMLTSGPSRSSTTGPDGVAVLEGLDGEQSYALNVQPGDAGALLPYTQQDWRPGDLSVRLERGFAVSGVVRDPSGRPIKGANVYRQVPDGGWHGLSTDEAGRFRLMGLSAGPVVLRAAAPGDQGEWQREGAAEQTVPGGTENVEFVLDPGVELIAELVLPPGVLRPEGYALLIVEREGQAQGVTHGHWSNGAPVRFPGLKRNERYSIWVAPQKDDWYGWLPEARAGGAPVKVRFERGQSIRGKLSVPADASQLSVHARDTLNRQVQGVVAADGSYEIKGVPPGAWTVGAWCQKGGEHLHAEAPATAGGTADLVLEPHVR